jgi:hypothetical protein
MWFFGSKRQVSWFVSLAAFVYMRVPDTFRLNRDRERSCGSTQLLQQNAGILLWLCCSNTIPIRHTASVSLPENLLCCLVVEYLATDQEVPGSIPDTTRFS